MSAVVQIVTSLDTLGGAQRVAVEIAARLHSEKRPQWLLAGCSDVAASSGALTLVRKRLAERGARLVLVPSLSNETSPFASLAALDEIHARLVRIRAELPRRERLIVHTHSIKAGLVGRMAGRAMRGSRVVHTLHGFAFDVLGGARGRALVMGVERLAASFGDVQLFVSDADRETARHLRIGARARSLVVRAGVDVTRYTGAALDAGARRKTRSELGASDDAPVAVTVGNLKPQKDPLFHVEVLAAWRALGPASRDARLVFLGDGPLRAATEARAKTLAVDAALSLPGAQAPAPWLAAADVMLLASQWEGLPCSVLEGLAAGLPVVVKDAGWGRDLAFAGAMLTRAGESASPVDVARALEAARQTPKRAVALPAEFTVDGMLLALSSLYDELAS